MSARSARAVFVTMREKWPMKEANRKTERIRDRSFSGYRSQLTVRFPSYMKLEFSLFCTYKLEFFRLQIRRLLNSTLFIKGVNTPKCLLALIIKVVYHVPLHKVSSLIQSCGVQSAHCRGTSMGLSTFCGISGLG